MRIVIELENSKEIQQKLTRLGAGLTDFTIAMKALGGDVRDYMAGPAFASQGGVFGEPWQKLSEPYASGKAKRYAGRPILVASGAMSNAFRSKSNRTSAVIENSDPKFEWHQLGKGRNPQRRMIGINDKVRQMIKDELERDTARKLKKAGF